MRDPRISKFITSMIIFLQMIEDIGGRYTRLLLASMQPAPAIKLILPFAARLGIRGAAFYLVQRPHLPPLSSKLSFVPSPTTISLPLEFHALSKYTRIRDIFHFDSLILLYFVLALVYLRIFTYILCISEAII